MSRTRHIGRVDPNKPVDGYRFNRLMDALDKLDVAAQPVNFGTYGRVGISSASTTYALYAWADQTTVIAPITAYSAGKAVGISLYFDLGTVPSSSAVVLRRNRGGVVKDFSLAVPAGKYAYALSFDKPVSLQAEDVLQVRFVTGAPWGVTRNATAALWVIPGG